MNSSLRSQSGQTMVEYILLLLVILAMGLGTVWQLNSAFRTYAQGYFGNYIACLLKSGELPSLGEAPTNASAPQNALNAAKNSGGSGCDSEFQAFDLKNGRPASSLGASGSIQAQNANRNASKSGGKNGGAGSGSSSELNSDSSGSAGTDGNGPGSGYNSRVSASSSASKGSGKKIPLSNADRQGSDSFALKFGKNDLEVISEGGQLYGSGRDGSGSDYIPAPEEKVTLAPSKVPINEQDKKEKKGSYVSSTYNTRSVAAEDQENTYDFTSIFRWVVIICIIILMIIFFGGQAARISKSMEKSD